MSKKKGEGGKRAKSETNNVSPQGLGENASVVHKKKKTSGKRSRMRKLLNL